MKPTPSEASAPSSPSSQPAQFTVERVAALIVVADFGLKISYYHHQLQASNIWVVAKNLVVVVVPVTVALAESLAPLSAWVVALEEVALAQLWVVVVVALVLVVAVPWHVVFPFVRPHSISAPAAGPHCSSVVAAVEVVHSPSVVVAAVALLSMRAVPPPEVPELPVISTGASFVVAVLAACWDCFLGPARLGVQEGRVGLAVQVASFNLAPLAEALVALEVLLNPMPPAGPVEAVAAAQPPT